MNIITFIIYGLIMSMTFGGFFALILISGMKESFLRVVVSIIIALFLGFGLVFCIVKQSEHEAKNGTKAFALNVVQNGIFRVPQNIELVLHIIMFVIMGIS